MLDSLPSHPRPAVIGIDKWSVLAGVRFLLASVVAVNHLGAYTSLGFLAFIPKFGPFEAILGFLLISGYSISVSYTKQPYGFLGRRIQRLFPVYLAAIAATYMAGLVEGSPHPSIGNLVVNALFLNQLFTSTSFVVPAWSLSLEFWLYCLAPVLVRIPPARTRLLIYCSFACYVIYTPLRSLLHLPYYSGVGFGANLVLLSFIWIAGLRLALVQGQRETAMRDIRILLGGHILMVIGIQFMYRAKNHAIPEFFNNDLYGFAMQFATLAFVYLVFAHLVIAPRPGVRRSWLLRFMGDVSYPLYLLHAPIYVFLAKAGLVNPLWYYLAAVCLSAVVYQAFDFYSKKRHQQIGTN